jgi:hypothetical protein
VLTRAWKLPLSGLRAIEVSDREYIELADLDCVDLDCVDLGTAGLEAPGVCGVGLGDVDLGNADVTEEYFIRFALVDWEGLGVNNVGSEDVSFVEGVSEDSDLFDFDVALRDADLLDVGVGGTNWSGFDSDLVNCRSEIVDSRGSFYTISLESLCK